MLNARRILAILIKDLREARRDGRIILLLLLPIGTAVLFNATSPDEHALPTAELAVVDSGSLGLAPALRTAAGKSVKLTVRYARDERSARRLVADKDVDFAVIVAAPKTAGPVRADVLVAADASPEAQSVVALVPAALTRAAGREPAASMRVSAVATPDRTPGEMLQAREVTLVLMVVLLVVFVATMVVPIQVAEELEKGTLGALRLAATGPEILAAKAFAGFIYAAAGVGLTIEVTQFDVNAPLLFLGAAFALTVSLVGFGLMIGLLWPNSAAINTYGGVLTLPLIGLAGATLFTDSGILSAILDVLPFSQATKLLADGLSPRTPFHAGLASWAVIAAWALVGYLLLARIASRREI